MHGSGHDPAKTHGERLPAPEPTLLRPPKSSQAGPKGPVPIVTFGQVAIQLGFVSTDQVKECVDIQKRLATMGLASRRLGEILLEKGYLKPEQVQAVFEKQGAMGIYPTLEGYKILEKIGEGAMGTVYKAVQLSMDRVVAIKLLSPRLAKNAKFVERFITEARAAARLNHPNIIQGIDARSVSGLNFFVMEFVDGPTVNALLKRGGALDESRALTIVLHIARALQHADQNGLLHRDIKPDNIMVNRGGAAKLCDLGLARLIGPSVGREKDGMLGTPNYISPEQARGREDVDIRSDLYSLGATLYHMITGRVPFPGSNAAQVIAQHIHTEPVHPKELNPLLSNELSYIILKLMSKNPNDRYANPTDLVADFECLINEKTLPHLKQQAAAQQAARPAPRRPIPTRHLRRRRF